MKRVKQGGFTITELIIATAVFSGVLLLVIVGFTQIGRLFYKGVTVSQTRQTASRVMNAVTSDIRLTGTLNAPTFLCSPAANCNGPITYCIGNHLYIANAYQPVDLSSGNHDFSSKFGLIQSGLAPGNNCSGGSDPSGAYIPSDLRNPVEMLGDDMRVSAFNIQQSGDKNIYDIQVTITYGQDAVMNNPGTDHPSCKSVATGSQFCSVVGLSETVSSLPTPSP